jgi:eight-cysteine-cluster-containing protein
MKAPTLITITILILVFGAVAINQTIKEKPDIPEIKPPSEGGFCGTSTFAECITNDECTTGGCSSQICQGTNEEPLISTCEYKECYDPKTYEVNCQCNENKCQWK